MWKMLNVKWDTRTALNVLKIPFIICIRIPVVLLMRLIDCISEYADKAYEKLPGWKS